MNVLDPQSVALKCIERGGIVIEDAVFDSDVLTADQIYRLIGVLHCPPGDHGIGYVDQEYQSDVPGDLLSFEVSILYEKKLLIVDLVIRQDLQRIEILNISENVDGGIPRPVPRHRNIIEPPQGDRSVFGVEGIIVDR